MAKKKWIGRLFSGLLITICVNSYAATFVKFMTGDTYDVGDPSRNSLRFDQFNQWRYGDSYLFFEIGKPFDKGTTIYGEWAPRLSLSKLFKKKFQYGFIKDVFVASQINASGSGFRAYLYGVGFDFSIPGFKSLGLNIYARNNPDLPGHTYQLTPFWNYPFVISKLHFLFMGHMDLVGSEGPTYRQNQLIQPYLLVDVGRLFQQANFLWMGARYTYWHHASGTNINENALEYTLMMKLA